MTQSKTNVIAITIAIYIATFVSAVEGTILPTALPTATVTIISYLYPYEKRPQILGFNNLVWGIATLLVPLISGITVDGLNWYWVFFVNIPFKLLE